jgi:hypothetical protein
MLSQPMGGGKEMDAMRVNRANSRQKLEER